MLSKTVSLPVAKELYKNKFPQDNIRYYWYRVYDFTTESMRYKLYCYDYNDSMNLKIAAPSIDKIRTELLKFECELNNDLIIDAFYHSENLADTLALYWIKLKQLEDIK